jgi:putative ABC transport system permease protein
MAALREWLSRLWGTFRRNRSDSDLQDELQVHLELAAEEARRRGSSPAAAMRAARLQVGAVPQAIEALRDQRGLPWLEDLLRDVHYGCRALARSPGFTIASAISLAVGIGANCAVFSFADTLLLRPLSVPRSGELLTVGSTGSARGSLLASYRDYVDLRDRSQSFAGLIPFAQVSAAMVTTSHDAAKQSLGMVVSSDFFRVVGVAPALGRDFRSDEDQVPGRSAVVILSHDLWERQLGADKSILGRTVRLNGIEFTVVGIAPAGFTGLSQFTRAEFYAPFMMWPRLTADPTLRPLEARDFRTLTIKGRLKPHVTLSQAQAELNVIAGDLERASPETNRNRSMALRSELQNRIANTPPVAILLVMLSTLAGAVLFIACANVAGLLISRAPVRSREIALRMAIGAGRGRLIRQLMTESVLLAMIGGALGLAVGYAAVVLFSRIQIPTDLPIVVAFELDRRAVLFSLAVTLASAVLCGIAPAIQATRMDLTAVMKAPDAAAFGHARRLGRSLLVMGQVAVSLVLVVIATFVYRGFQRQLASGPGFRVDHLLMMHLAPRQLRYSEEQAQRFFERVAEQARNVTGVKSVALTRYMPMDGLAPSVTILLEGFQFPAGTENAVHASSIVDEDYFDTLRLPIVEGRGFRATDSASAPKVAVVNELFAERYWPGQHAVGKRFRLDNNRGPWVEIIGVAKTTKYGFAIERPMEFVYFPFRQRPAESMFLLTQFDGDPSTVATALRGVVTRTDADVPISNVRTMEELFRMRSTVVLDVLMTTIGAMGIMGLVLAIVGLYGLVAYAASRRTKEIGVRMAIGASRLAVLRMVLQQGMVPAIAGLAVGLIASLGAARALGTVFRGGAGGEVGTDFVAFVLVMVAVVLVTLFAAYVPARRASHINPIEALRHE